MRHFINHLVRALSTIAIVASCAHALNTGTQDITPGAAGWIWSGMVEYVDPELTDGVGRAGGPGTYGAYTFRGTGVTVYVMSAPVVSIDGRSHKMGNIKVSIDGHEMAVAVSHGASARYHVPAYENTELTDSVHVLQIEPDDGWAVVDSVHVLEAASADDSANDAIADSSMQVPANLSEGDYRIMPRSAENLWLDVWEKGSTDGNPLQVYVPNLNEKQPNQWFHLTPVATGEYRLTPLNAPTKAVTMLSATMGGYAISAIWEYKADPAQVWHITVVEAGLCRITPSSATSLALSAYGTDTENGAAVLCMPWKRLPDQEWTLMSQ